MRIVTFLSIIIVKIEDPDYAKMFYEMAKEAREIKLANKIVVDKKM
jgi:hypothetical protein